MAKVYGFHGKGAIFLLLVFHMKNFASVQYLFETLQVN